MNSLSFKENKLKYIIAGIQIFDIVIHVAVNRAEPLRIASNIVTILWIISQFFDIQKAQEKMVSYATIIVYLALNIWFIIADNVFSYFTGQELGFMFTLIISTFVLSTIMTVKMKEKN